MRPLIIGLGHKCRSGKNVAAAAISQYYLQKRVTELAHRGSSKQPKVQSVSFAESLKEYCRVVHGMTEKNPKLLQDVGHAKRQEDPQYWIRRAWAKFKPDSDIILLTDLRYENEAHTVLDLGGFVVDVRRFNKDGSQFISGDRPADHPSETELDGFPALILANTDGHEGLFCEQAITLAEYLWGIHSGR